MESESDENRADGYEVVSGPRATGDGYYESCIVAVEGNQIEITVRGDLERDEISKMVESDTAYYVLHSR